MPGKRGRTLAERFWEKVRKTDGCWLWTGSTGRTGQGRIGVGGRGTSPALASRVSWELHNGPIPEGLCVCHTCDNPTCVRIDHLWLGGQRDNLRDMTAKGRRRGGKPSRYSPDEITQMRHLRSAGALIREIASRFECSEPLVRHLMKRRDLTHSSG